MCILSCPIYKNQKSIHDTIHVLTTMRKCFQLHVQKFAQMVMFSKRYRFFWVKWLCPNRWCQKRPISATINATVTCGVMVWFPSRGYSYSALNPFPFLSLSRSRSRHKSFYFSSFCSLPLCKQSYLTFFLLIDIWYNLSLLLLKFYL